MVFPKLPRLFQTRLVQSVTLARFFHSSINRKSVYRPLDSEAKVIRLLELHPGTDNDELKCGLSYHSLDAIPPYEALSYRWGSNLEKTSIALDEMQLAITPSITVALRRLRDHSVARMLWIDQICINQGDRAERGQQVGLMRDIYQEAKRVIIWLGEGAATQKAVAFIDDLGTVVKYCFQNDKYDRLQSIFTDKDLRPEMAAIVQGILSNPYFDRYWIIQEVVLSRDAIVASGTSTAKWSTVVLFLDGLKQYNPQFIRSVRDELGLLGSMGHIPKRLATFQELRCELTSNLRSTYAFSLWNLVVAFRYSQAKDPSDKIYALLGLSRDWETTGFKIDYERSAHETYALFTRAMMEQDGYLKWLAHAGSPRSYKDLPSWVPDLELPIGYKPDVLSLQPGLYAADKDATAKFHFSADSSSLHCEGVRIDSISFLTTDNLLGICAYAHWQADISTFDELTKSFQAAKTRYGDNFLAILQTMCTAERGVPLHDTGVARTSSGMPIASLLVSEAEGDLPEQKAWVSAMRLLMESTLSKRAAFISRKGYVGLVPEYAREGDIIYVVFGHDVPAVLREEDNHYRFIGECYVAGVMDGEYSVLLERGETKVEQFELR